MPQTSPQRSDQGFQLRVAGGPQAASRARRELSRLGEELEPPVLESARLLVTELVTNAVRHAGVGAIEMSVQVCSESLRIDVSNRGAPFEAHARVPRPDQESGWGLFLVDRLSDEWGVVDEPGRQRVWFELRR